MATSKERASVEDFDIVFDPNGATADVDAFLDIIVELAAQELARESKD